MFSITKFASIDKQREIKVWDTSSFPYKVTFRGEHAYDSYITQITNDRFATGSFYGEIKIWNALNFQLIQRLLVHKNLILKIIELNPNQFSTCAQDQKVII